MSLEKVNDNVKALAAKFEGALNFDADGVGNGLDEVIAANLPEGLTTESLDQAQQFVLDTADAVSLALGNRGLKQLGDNKELNSVSVRAKVGKSQIISSEFQRSVERRNPGTGESFTKHGVISTKLTTGVGASRGNYKRIQEDLSERAASIFAQ